MTYSREQIKQEIKTGKRITVCRPVCTNIIKNYRSYIISLLPGHPVAVLQRREYTWPILPTPITVVSSSRTRPQQWLTSALICLLFQLEQWSEGEKKGFLAHYVRHWHFFMHMIFTYHTDNHKRTGNSHEECNLLRQWFCLGQNTNGWQVLGVRDTSSGAYPISLILYS